MILSIKRILNDNMEKVTQIFPVSLKSRESGLTRQDVNTTFSVVQ